MAHPLEDYFDAPCEKTFGALHGATRGFVWAICLRLSRDRSAAEEAFQSTWCRIVELARSEPRERPPGDPARAVGLIALRESGRLRKRAERRERRERALKEASHVVDTRQPGPEEVADHRERRERVESLLATLPREERAAVELHYLHAFSVREIAAAIGEARSTVSDRIRRAVSRLDARFRREGLERASILLPSLGSSLAWIEPPARLAPTSVRSLVRDGAVSASDSGAVASSTAAAGVAVGAVTTATTIATSGGLAVKIQSAVVALVVVSAIGAVLLWPPTREPAARTSTEEASLALESPGPEGIEDPARSPDAADPVPSTPGERGEGGQTAGGPTGTSSGVVVRVRVLDAETDEPVPEATVWRLRGEERATSGDEGQCDLVLGREGNETVTVAVSADGYTRRTEEIRLPAEDACRVEVRLDPALTVVVQVVDEDGRPVEAARVAPPSWGVEGVYSDEGTVETGPDGRATLEGLSRLHPPSLWVSREGFRSAHARVETATDGRATPLRIVLAREEAQVRVVEGHIVDPHGRPIAGARVEWKDAERDSFGAGIVHGEPHALSDASGSYRLEVEQPGPTCHLGVSARGFGPRVESDVELGTIEEPARHDVCLDVGHILRGRVIDEAEKPVASVRVVAMPALHLLDRSVAYPGVRREATTDEEGCFEILDVSGPRVAVEVTARGRPSLRVVVDTGEEVDIVLDSFGIIRGHVVDDETGEPVTAFTVRMQGQPQGASVALRGRRFSREDGRFSWGPLAPAPAVSIRVDAEGYGPAIRHGLEVDSERGSVEHEFRLRPARSIEGTVVDELSNEPLSGVAVAGTSREDASSLLAAGDWERFSYLWDFEATRTAPDGTFRLPDALDPPGTTILVRADGYRRLCIRPTERDRWRSPGGGLRLSLWPGEGIRGRVTDGLGERTGRRVKLHRVGDGVDLEALATMPGNLSGLHATADTDPRGRFRFADVSPGTWVLDLAQPAPEVGPSYAAHLRRLVRVEEGDTIEVDLGAADATASLSGRVRGVVEAGAVFAEIVLRRVAADGEGGSDVSGSSEPPVAEVVIASTHAPQRWGYAFPALRPGTYRAEVRYARAGGDLRFVVERIDVAGRGELDLWPSSGADGRTGGSEE